MLSQWLAEGVSASAGAASVRIVDREALLLDGVDEVDRGAAQVGGAHAIGDDADSAELAYDIAIEAAVIEEELVPQARASARLNRHAKGQVIATLGFEQGLDLQRRGVGEHDAIGRDDLGLGRCVSSHGCPFHVEVLAAVYDGSNRSPTLSIPGHAWPIAASQEADAVLREDNGPMTDVLRDPVPTPLALLLMGKGSDPESERGVECPGDLPAASDPGLVERALAARATLADRVFILGHHYQRDEVIEFADVTGDSFKLAQQAAAHPEAEFIVFCGVHFMAESADILTSPDQHVILPDLAAGCSMADMADIAQVEDCWDVLTAAGIAEVTVPITYMNSTAAINAFTGRHGGSVCTSSNAQRSLEWAFAHGEKVLFLPDQHLGRNTAVFDLGLSHDDCVVFNPLKPGGGLSVEDLRAAKVILWRGHCSVHGRFTADEVDEVRVRVPGVNVIVHPECRYEVVEKADYVGSTEKIITTIAEAEPGTSWAVGTELNLVKRLGAMNPDKQVVYLDRTVCFCSTMNRIDLPHLVWVLESLVAGNVVNRIEVDADTAHWARVALDRMLALPGAAPAKD